MQCWCFKKGSLWRSLEGGWSLVPGASAWRGASAIHCDYPLIDWAEQRWWSGWGSWDTVTLVFLYHSEEQEVHTKSLPVKQCRVKIHDRIVVPNLWNQAGQFPAYMMMILWSWFCLPTIMGWRAGILTWSCLSQAGMGFSRPFSFCRTSEVEICDDEYFCRLLGVWIQSAQYFAIAVIISEIHLTNCQSIKASLFSDEGLWGSSWIGWVRKWFVSWFEITDQ